MFTKDQILDEIRRTAQENGGRPLGLRRFESVTGIQPSEWLSRFWARWGDALIEAGFEANELQGAFSEEYLLRHLADFSRELGAYPTSSEIDMRARTNPGFPWDSTYRRLGRKQEIATRLKAFSDVHGYNDVAAYCEQVLSALKTEAPPAEPRDAAEKNSAVGYVYLMKSGRHHKIGRSNAVGRRERELAIQLPEKAKVCHSIKTDDPAGIEAYWHNRFADKRKNGEWFELTAQDVAAFKRRKFM